MKDYIGLYECKCGSNRWTYFANKKEYACGTCGRRVGISDFSLFCKKRSNIQLDIGNELGWSRQGLKEKYRQGEKVVIESCVQSFYLCDKCNTKLLIKELPTQISINGYGLYDKIYMCPKCKTIYLECSASSLRSQYYFSYNPNLLKRINDLFLFLQDETNGKKDINNCNMSMENNVNAWKLKKRAIKNISSVTKVRITGTNQVFYMGNGNGNLSFVPNMNNFYDSNYACPYCEKPMFKTIFPVGGEYLIQTDDGKVNMKRVFTCSKCYYFVTAANDLLSDGFVYENKVPSNNEYIKLLKDMNNKGTTQGRAD